MRKLLGVGLLVWVVVQPAYAYVPKVKPVEVTASRAEMPSAISQEVPGVSTQWLEFIRKTQLEPQPKPKAKPKKGEKEPPTEYYKPIIRTVRGIGTSRTSDTRGFVKVSDADTGKWVFSVQGNPPIPKKEVKQVSPPAYRVQKIVYVRYVCHCRAGCKCCNGRNRVSHTQRRTGIARTR